MKEFKHHFMSWKISSILAFLLSLFLPIVLVKDLKFMSRFISHSFKAQQIIRIIYIVWPNQSHIIIFIFFRKIILHSQLTTTPLTLGYFLNVIRTHLEFLISSGFSTLSQVTYFPCAKKTFTQGLLVETDAAPLCLTCSHSQTSRPITEEMRVLRWGIFYEMCSIPCIRFVWLSKPQLQQARTEFPKT